MLHDEHGRSVYLWQEAEGEDEREGKDDPVECIPEYFKVIPLPPLQPINRKRDYFALDINENSENVETLYFTIIFF